MKRGRFLTLEGSEAVGKTTQIEQLRVWLEQQNISVYCTREPGGTPLAEALRAIVLDPAYADAPAMAELLVMFAARADHYHREIAPRLAAGQWVLCDRFVEASYAYQGGGRMLGESAVANLHELVLDGVCADLTIFLDLQPELAKQRLHARGALDKIESSPDDFFQRVRKVYQRRAQADPKNRCLVDASGDVAQVFARIRSEVEAFSARWSDE